MLCQLLRLLPILAMFWGAAGCGGGSSDMPELGTVTGTVTMDGQPLANVTVTFKPDSGSISVGRTDEQGHYKLGYNETEKGAKVGKHTVRITTPSDEPGPGGDAPKDPIPAKYNEQSELSADVKAGSNEFNFDLTSK